MTFDAIVERIKSRLNHTSSEATTRIGLTVNDRYRRATSDLGIVLPRQGVVSATATIGTTTMTFANTEKLFHVQDRSTTPWRVLTETSVEILRQRSPSARVVPREYAIYASHADSVTILLDCVPETEFVLYADAMRVVADLSGSNEPAFPESYHDILYYGGLAEEYMKLEKQALAKYNEGIYESRLSQLRLNNAASASKAFYQGKNKYQTSSAPTSGGAGSSAGTSGTGTTGTLTIWTATDSLGDSILTQDGSNILFNETSSPNSTIGLTINQGAADDHILTCKSSDVTTAITTAFSAYGSTVETDDYFFIQKRSAAIGGALLVGLMENTGADRVLALHAFGGTATSSKSAGASGLIDIFAAQHDGANSPANIAADGNIVVISGQVGGAKQARWLVDEDGDTWQAGGATFALGPVFVGDNANAANLAGLTVNQGAADDVIVSLKSSDVATGLSSVMTPNVETDDFCTICKAASTTGGVTIRGLAEQAPTVVTSLVAIGGTADTTKTTSGRALIEVNAAQHDGANVLADIAANGNVFGVRARRGAAEVSVFLIDEDGDVWINATSGVLLSTGTALTNGAAAQTATMTNGPTAGDPTKWIPINDNGTTRYIPAW